MSGGFSALGIAISGMNASQRALEVTGHNISNLNTTGYVRQQAMMGDSRYATDATGRIQIGTGVDVAQIRQIRQSFLDNIYRAENNGLQYWETRSKALGDLETIMGDPLNETLQGSLNAFWDSWHELSKDPSSLAVRAMVRQSGERLVETINHIGEQVSKLQNDLNTEIIIKIDEFNSITSKIAKLNTAITSMEIGGNLANDYYDQRNMLLDQLSGLANIEVRELVDGQVDVTVGGYFVVNRSDCYKLIAQERNAGDIYVVPKLEEYNVELKMGKGIISGLIEARGDVSGKKGSYYNGTPNLDTEINIIVDVSDTSGSNLFKLKENIERYTKVLSDQGLNHNIRLITYDGTGVLSNVNFGKDLTGFSSAVKSLAPTTNVGNDFADVITELDTILPFGDDANRHAVLFTGESLDGDGTPASVATVASYLSKLTANNIKLSVVTDPALNSASPDVGEPGWEVLTRGTGGNLYNINSVDFEGVITQLNEDINDDVNKGFSKVNEDTNIISSIKKKLNAMINIMAREVNKLHLSGKTLTGLNGVNFFEPISTDLPMEMGNIRVSLAINDLNNIVASTGQTNGDNTIVKKITELRLTSFIEDTEKPMTVDEYYQAIIMNVGNIGRTASGIAESQRKLVEAADNDRNSIMGVSLDEEMTHMMKFKYSYNAATKSISVVNEMLDTVINRMGHVGRS